MTTDLHIGQTDDLKFLKKSSQIVLLHHYKLVLFYLFFATFCMNLLSCRKDFDLHSNS